MNRRFWQATSCGAALTGVGIYVLGLGFLIARSVHGDNLAGIIAVAVILGSLFLFGVLFRLTDTT